MGAFYYSAQIQLIVFVSQSGIDRKAEQIMSVDISKLKIQDKQKVHW